MTLNNSATTILEPAPPKVRDLNHIPRWKVSDAAAVITALVVVGTTATMFLPLQRGLGVSGFTFENVMMIGVVDTSSQRLAHRVGLLLLATLCLLALAAITRPAAHSTFIATSLRNSGEFLRKWCGILLVTAAAMVPLFNLHGTVFPGHGPLFAFADGQKLRLGFWLISICLVALQLIWVRRRKTRRFTMAIWSCVAVYVTFLTLPGFIRVPFLFEPLLSWTEMHYNWTVAQGDRLAAGLRLGSQVNLNYGLIHSLFLGVFERHFGFLNFGEHFRLVQLSQVAFLTIAIWAFYLWKPGNPLFVMFGALLIGPWVSTSHFAVYYANQSGWRSFGLAAGVAILLMCRRQPARRLAIALGASACFLLLYNPETGLCLSFGYGLFLLSRQRNLSPAFIGEIAVRAAAGAVIVFLTVLIFFRAGLGNWPPLSGILPFDLIGKFGQGYAGVRLYFDPLAILIFVHSTYVLSSSVLKWRVRDLEFDESVKLAIAATILTWAGYYVNRPQPWTLWTYQFLYIFLIGDFFEAGLLRRLSSRGIAAISDFRMASLTFVLLPMLLFNNYYILLRTLYPPRNPGEAHATVLGISMTETSANTLRTQAEFLMSQKASSTLFFSRHSYSLSLLTQRFTPLSVQDALSETITNSDFESLVNEIFRLSPHVILFDPPDNSSLVVWAPANGPTVVEDPAITYFYMRFFNRLKIRLGERYSQGPIAGGWQVWQLQSPDTKSNGPSGY